MVGVVPALRATTDAPGYQIGHFYSWNGLIHSRGRTVDAAEYRNGDAITATLDLGTNTVAFSTNGRSVGEALHVAHEPYYFAVDASGKGAAVTITSMK